MSLLQSIAFWCEEGTCTLYLFLANPNTKASPDWLHWHDLPGCRRILANGSHQFQLQHCTGERTPPSQASTTHTAKGKKGPSRGSSLGKWQTRRGSRNKLPLSLRLNNKSRTSRFFAFPSPRVFDFCLSPLYENYSSLDILAIRGFGNLPNLSLFFFILLLDPPFIRGLAVYFQPLTHSRRGTRRRKKKWVFCRKSRDRCPSSSRSWDSHRRSASWSRLSCR